MYLRVTLKRNDVECQHVPRCPLIELRLRAPVGWPGISLINVGGRRLTPGEGHDARERAPASRPTTPAAHLDPSTTCNKFRRRSRRSRRRTASLNDDESDVGAERNSSPTSPVKIVLLPLISVATRGRGSVSAFCRITDRPALQRRQREAMSTVSEQLHGRALVSRRICVWYVLKSRYTAKNR